MDWDGLIARIHLCSENLRGQFQQKISHMNAQREILDRKPVTQLYKQKEGWVFCPPGNESISHLAKRKHIDPKVPFWREYVVEFPGGYCKWTKLATCQLITSQISWMPKWEVKLPFQLPLGFPPQQPPGWGYDIVQGVENCQKWI